MLSPLATSTCNFLTRTGIGRCSTRSRPLFVILREGAGIMGLHQGGRPRHHGVVGVSALSTFSTGTRPFAVLGVQQIAIGSENREGLDRLWYEVLGVPRPTTPRVEIASENVQEDIVSLGPGPFAVEIDLMTPIDASKRPQVHVPPLNHIGLWVDPLEEAVAWMSERGVRFTAGGIRPGAAGHNVTFIHPKGNDASPIGGNGVLIELVQAPPHVVQAFRGLKTGVSQNSNDGSKE